MPDTAPPWLESMRGLIGTREFPGPSHNPVILGWARYIGLRWPEMAEYANNFTTDEIANCGVGAAWALAQHGIKPPFGATDTKRWMWAQSFADPAWSDKLSGFRLGALAVFRWRNGGGHVGFAERVEGNRVWVTGSNQGDAVSTAPFAIDDQFLGFFWPRHLAAAAAPIRTPADVRRRMGAYITLAEARRDAQGRLAVYYLPAGDGGGAYEVAGINERWHPVAASKLKSLIESGRHAEAEAFVGDYLGSYTDVADVWTSSWGVEFYSRDSVFNRGPTGGAMILQLALKSLGYDLGQSGKLRDGVDGEVGPLTANAMRQAEADPPRLLQAMRDAREYYERNGHLYIDGGPNRDESSQFWRGLVNRWNNQLTIARRFHAEQPSEQKESPVTNNEQPSPASLGMNQRSAIDLALLIAPLLPPPANTVLPLLLRGQQALPPPTIESAPQPQAQPDPKPATTATPAKPSFLDRPGTQLGLLGGISALVAQMLGGLPASAVVGPATEVATGAGNAISLISAFAPLIGGSGIFGTLLRGGLQLLANVLPKQPAR